MNKDDLFPLLELCVVRAHEALAIDKSEYEEATRGLEALEAESKQ